MASKQSRILLYLAIILFIWYQFRAINSAPELKEDTASLNNAQLKNPRVGENRKYGEAVVAEDLIPKMPHFNSLLQQGPCSDMGEIEILPSPSEVPLKPRALMAVHLHDILMIRLDNAYETLLTIIYRFNQLRTRQDTEIVLVVHWDTEKEKIQRALELGARVIKVKQLKAWDYHRGRLMAFGLEMYKLVALLENSMFAVTSPDEVFTWYDHERTAGGQIGEFWAAKHVGSGDGKWFNMGIYIYEPTCKKWTELYEASLKPDTYSTAKYDEFTFLNWYFKGKWMEIPYRFNAQFLGKIERVKQEKIVFIHDNIWDIDAEWRPWQVQKLWWDLHHELVLMETKRMFDRAPPATYGGTKRSIMVISMDLNHDNVNVYFPTTHDKYANTNGYSYRYALHNQVPNRAPVWNKMILIQQAFDLGYEWVWWVDSDSLFLNMNLRVEDHILAHAESQRRDRGESIHALDFIASHDCSGYNAGSFLLRNTPWSRQFLKRVFELDMTLPHDAYYHEQSAMAYVISHFPEFAADHVEWVPQRLVNAYGTGPCGYQYQDGDVLAHFPGTKTRIPMFREISKTGKPWRDVVYAGK